jgi:hypothetical protein
MKTPIGSLAFSIYELLLLSCRPLEKEGTRRENTPGNRFSGQ